MEKQGIFYATGSKALTITVSPHWVSFVIESKAGEAKFGLDREKALSLADFLNTKIIKGEDVKVWPER